MLGPDTDREKYLDWCAGRISDLLGALSDEEVSLRADREIATPAGPSLYPHIEDARTRALIDSLHRELHLPSFEIWLEAYRAAPEAFEQDLLFRQTDATSTPI